MSKKHQYRITVEPLDSEGAVDTARSFTFQARCHDDLVAIAERARSGGKLPPEDATAMAVGLKLLGETALEHRNEELFSDLCGHIGTFIKKLKTGHKPNVAA